MRLPHVTRLCRANLMEIAKPIPQIRNQKTSVDAPWSREPEFAEPCPLFRRS